ncbi:uncharacterized protein LOC119647181 [Hermetia illucens]|uniref:uncharacterized protein LOC119647181 n=1 Tax=Hermetia illucens TaxID=343691 RepID=UPI0018CC09E4|nr:uncharacterized protein LOC119647181 [Hermetia illucens]
MCRTVKDHLNELERGIKSATKRCVATTYVVLVAIVVPIDDVLSFIRPQASGWCGGVIEITLFNITFPGSALKKNWLTGGFNVKKLFISNSELKAIESDAFKSPVFRQLTELEISYASIAFLKKGSFDHLTSLTNLKLDHSVNDFSTEYLDGIQNNIKQIEIHGVSDLHAPNELFGSLLLPKLQTLDLGNNNFGDTINESTFQNVTPSSILNLTDCKISSLHPRTFKVNRAGPASLYLENNNLKKVSDEVFEPMVERYIRFTITLRGNPWNCTYELLPLIKLITENERVYADNPKCASPPEFAGKELHPDIFVTLPATTTTEGSISSTTSTTKPITTTTEMPWPTLTTTAEGSISPTANTTFTTTTEMSSPISTTSTEGSTSSTTITTNAITTTTATAEGSISSTISTPNTTITTEMFIPISTTTTKGPTISTTTQIPASTSTKDPEESSLTEIVCEDHVEDICTPGSCDSKSILYVKEMDIKFNISKVSSRAVQITIERPAKDFSIVWFTPAIKDFNKVQNHYTEHNLGCVELEMQNFTIQGLELGAVYIFCIVKGNDAEMTPLNCRSHLVEVDCNETDLLDPESKTALVWSVVSILAAVLLGAVTMFCVIQFNPALLKGTKRIVILAKNTAEVPIIPKGKSKSDKVLGMNSIKRNISDRRLSSVSTESTREYTVSDYEVISSQLATTIRKDSLNFERLQTNSPPPLPKILSEGSVPQLTIQSDKLECAVQSNEDYYVLNSRA